MICREADKKLNLRLLHLACRAVLLLLLLLLQRATLQQRSSPPWSASRHAKWQPNHPSPPTGLKGRFAI